MITRMMHFEGRESRGNVADGHWSEYPAGSEAREEALFLEAVRGNMSVAHVAHHCGMSLEEVARVTRRLIGKQRLSPQSKYAKLLLASKRLPVFGGKRGQRPARAEAAE